MSLTEKLFKVKERGSSTKTEFLGAVSAYLAVCYLFIVVPGMLADAGMPIGDATVATIWAAVLGTLMIAFIANYPVVVAPGLGISAYFAYYVCGAMGLSWQAACAAVVISGFVFFILTVTRVRQAIIKAIPLDLKLAIVAGIGAFITIIGLKNAGIVVATPSTMIGLGNMMGLFDDSRCCARRLDDGQRHSFSNADHDSDRCGLRYCYRCHSDRRNSQSFLRQLQDLPDGNDFPSGFQTDANRRYCGRTLLYHDGGLV